MNPNLMDVEATGTKESINTYQIQSDSINTYLYGLWIAILENDYNYSSQDQSGVF